MRKQILRFSLALLVVFVPLFAKAQQLTAPTQAIALSMNIPETLTLNLSTNSLTLAQPGGAFSTYTVSASYNFQAARTIYISAWFSSPTAAMTNQGNSASVIPAADMGSMVNGVNGTACNLTETAAQSAIAVAGASCGVLQQTAITANSQGTTANAVAGIGITAGTPVGAGTYVGSLNIGVQAE